MSSGELCMTPPIHSIYKAILKGGIKHIFAEGGRGGAKSIGFGDILSILGCQRKMTVLCCREVQKSINESVHEQLVQRANNIGLPYESTEKKIFNELGTKFIFGGLSGVQINNIKSKYNISAAWVEEAQSTTAKSIQFLKDTIRAPGAFLMYSYNREKLVDPVHALCLSYKVTLTEKKAVYNGKVYRWKEGISECGKAMHVHMNYDSNTLFPEELETERLHDYEKHKEAGTMDQYYHTWEGRPAPNTGSSVLTVAQVTAAANRNPDTAGAIEIGVDVARGGKDKVVMYKRKGMAVIDRREYSNNSKEEIMRVTQTAERVEAFAGHNKDVPIKVDDTGVGGGLSDILIDKGYNVVCVNFGAKAQEEDRYNNTISEMWFNFAQVIDEVTIPDIPELHEELYSRFEDRKDSRGRRKIESKDEFKKRFQRSPDDADALLLTFYECEGEDIAYAVV